MALINFQTMGSGLEAVEFDTVGGTNSMVISPVWTNSTYSFRCNPVTTATGFSQISGFAATGIDAVYSIATTYVSLYFQYAVAPAVADEPILQVRQSTNTKFEVRIDSTGKLYGYNTALTLVASGTTALAANTWYRIDLKVGSSATVGAYELRINTVAEWSGTTNTLAANGTNIRIGKHTNRNGNTVDFYYGPVVLDDANYVSQPNFYVATLMPDANGSTMQWTSGTAPSDYTQVNERPPSATNYVKNSLAINQLALFSVQNRSAYSIDSNAVYLGLKGRIRLSEDINATSSQIIRVKSGATNSDSSANNGGTAAASVSRLLTTDPATGAAWTGAAIDAVEVGALEQNAVADRLSWAAVDLLYFIQTAAVESESVTVSESISYYSDSVIVSESRGLTLAHNAKTSDAIALSESVKNDLIVSAIASEAITVTEVGTVDVKVELSATDTITATEVVVAVEESFINTSDSTTVADTPEVFIPFFVVNTYDIVGSDPPKFIYTTDGDVMIYVFKSGTKWFYEKI
tara:strand:+ start:2612 stop:4171 length:1560 start_codon:yes stop_codon:yes gene_type:complete